LEDYLKGSKKTEAKVSLNVIYTAQKIYFVTHQTYVDTMSKLDVQLDSQGSAFYIINLSGNNTFSTATAIGNLDVDATGHL